MTTMSRYLPNLVAIRMRDLAVRNSLLIELLADPLDVFISHLFDARQYEGLFSVVWMRAEVNMLVVGVFEGRVR